MTSEFQIRHYGFPRYTHEQTDRLHFRGCECSYCSKLDKPLFDKEKIINKYKTCPICTSDTERGSTECVNTGKMFINWHCLMCGWMIEETIPGFTKEKVVEINKYKNKKIKTLSIGDVATNDREMDNLDKLTKKIREIVKKEIDNELNKLEAIPWKAVECSEEVVNWDELIAENSDIIMNEEQVNPDYFYEQPTITEIRSDIIRRREIIRADPNTPQTRDYGKNTEYTKNFESLW